MTKNTNYIDTVFEHAELTKIVGAPNYQNLKKIKDACAANAAQVESNLGGGAHSLLGTILTATEHALISPTPFTYPVHPGPFVIPNGNNITNMHREIARDQHKESVRVFQEVNAVQKAQIKQISKAVPELYLKQFQNVHSNAITITVGELLQSLITTYGKVDDDELQKAYDELKTKVFDISEPLIAMYNEVEELKSLSIAASNEYTERQLVNLGIKLIKNMGEFEIALGTWLSMPVAARTWLAFKTHFDEAQELLKQVCGPTLKNAHMQQTANSITEQVIAEVRDTLAAEKTDMFEKLEATERSIINAVSSSSSDDNSASTEDSVPPPTQNINVTTTDAVAMKILELLQELKDDMKANRKRPPSTNNGGKNKGGNSNDDKNAGGNNQNKKKKRRRTNISKYCWSCGAWNHPGKNCRFKKPGHKDDATFENKMGGSLLYCMECNQE